VCSSWYGGPRALLATTGYRAVRGCGHIFVEDCVGGIEQPKSGLTGKEGFEGERLQLRACTF
jgi:hypothetical protein